jgi:hypothetical protein
MKKKGFDCVAFQYEAALRIYEEIKDMTVKEQVAWWKRRAAELGPAAKSARKPRRSRKTAAR